ncbi:MAG TPA: tetratricopeptide repeat protein [Kofleriaceae bacterium]|nr:tetratricopeptide repeat protein [Kofleriaceae bacterium]
MSERLKSHVAVLGAVLLLAAGACGGKDKGAKSPGSPDTTGMSDGDAKGTGTVSNPGGAPGGNGGGANLPTPNGTGPEDPDDPNAGQDPDDGRSAAPVKAEPPVSDISEADAKQQVEASLKVARSALAGSNRDPNAAIKATKEALAVDPNNVDAVVLLAHAYYFRKLYDTADVILLRALSSPNKKISNKAGQHAGLFYVRGLVYDETDQGEKAQLAYEEAHKLDPRHRGALLNLAVHYIKDSRYAEAQGMLETLTSSLGVTTAAAWNNLGSAYRGRSVEANLSKAQRDEFLTKAETAYKRSVDRDKNYGPAYYNLGLLYMDAKPFPMGGSDLDELKRLERAKTYFSDYRTMPGADINLVDENLRQVDKAIKKEQKARKKKTETKDDDW